MRAVRHLAVLESCELCKIPAAFRQQMTAMQLSKNLRYLGTAVMFVAVLSMAAAYAPAAVRKIGLFSIVFGIVVGWGLGQLHRQYDLVGRTIVTIATALLIIAGLVNVAIQSHQQLRAERRNLRADNDQQRLALQLLAGSEGEDSATTALLRSQYDPSFADYLANRFSALGEWPLRWAVLAWLLEIGLAVAVGIWTVRRICGSSLVPSLTTGGTPEEQDEPSAVAGVNAETERT